MINYRIIARKKAGNSIPTVKNSWKVGTVLPVTGFTFRVYKIKSVQSVQTQVVLINFYFLVPEIFLKFIIKLYAFKLCRFYESP
jgi:hypothetical protein